MGGCIVTLVAFDWFFSLVSLFLQDFLTLWTKVIILTCLFHCVVFCPNGSFTLIWVKNHNLTFSRHTFTFDEYKDKDTRSSQKNVRIFNLRTISINVDLILSNSSCNLLFPTALQCNALQRCWAKIIIMIIDIAFTCWVQIGDQLNYQFPSKLWSIYWWWIYTWWEYDCVIFPPFIIMIY